MSVRSGPNIVQSGLKLSLDVDNLQSYPGEPTTNIISYPDLSNVADDNTGNTYIKSDINFEDDYTGMLFIQGDTANIESFSIALDDTTPTSGADLTFSAYLWATKTGGLLKSQVTVYVDGVRNWLQDDDSWTTDVNEYAELFKPTTTDAWHRVTKTVTLPAGTLTGLSLGGFYRNTGAWAMKIAKVQLEEKDHVTPFVNGTRSATDGWKDLSNNSNHVDIDNISFDSNAEPDFNGSNDYLDTGLLSGYNPSTTPYSFEFWAKSDSASGNEIIMGNMSGNGSSDRIYVAKYSNYWDMGIYNSSRGTSPITASTNTWTHFALVMDTPALTARLYINGVADMTKTFASFSLPGNVDFGWHGSYYWAGLLDQVRFYDRILTATEILQNYDAQSERYGL